LAIGLGVAIVIGVLLELGRNTITSVASLGKRGGYMVLGAAPELTPAALRELPPEWRSPLGCLAFQPGSQFATALRDLQATIGKDRVVAFVGSIPDEGATTTALGAAVCANQQGRRVLLIDCDLRRRSLTRALVGDVEAGVMEAAERPQNWRGLICHEPETGLHVMPAAKLKNPWSTLAASAGFPLLIEAMRQDYELIILDCPPLLGSAEGPLLARRADGCVVVAAWDDTPVGALRQSMRALRDRPKDTTGVYVNRVPPGYRFGRLRPD
jgi:Mrp family chromosome partitioning ATPase